MSEVCVCLAKCTKLWLCTKDDVRCSAWGCVGLCTIHRQIDAERNKTVGEEVVW